MEASALNTTGGDHLVEAYNNSSKPCSPRGAGRAVLMEGVVVKEHIDVHVLKIAKLVGHARP